MKIISTSLLIFLIGFLPRVIQSQTIYVNSNLAINGNGTSWGSAFNNLQSAIDLASSTNQIWLVAGTYLPSKDTTGNASPADNRTKTFFINKNVQIYGGFLGSESLISQANPTLNQTILSGDIGTVADSTDNAYHVAIISSWSNNIDNSCILSGITITKGLADGLPAEFRNLGGAIYFNATRVGKTTSPIFNTCSFVSNNARSGGACYFNIAGNTVSPKFINCVFKNNNAIGNMPLAPNGAGGAIRYNTNSQGICTATMMDCLFENNRAGSGGVIYNITFSGKSDLIFYNTYFINNKAVTGGVTYNCSNGATVTNTPNFTNCVFSENTASSTAATIYCIANSGETSPVVINCTFNKNTVGSASGNGATMYCNQSLGISRAKIYNSILWNSPNTVTSDVLNNNGTTVTISNCIYSDGVINGTISPTTGITFTNCIEVDPKFINIADLDGLDNILRTPDDGLNIQSTSNAINAGDNTLLSLAKTSNSFYKYSRNQSPLAPITDITGITDRILQNLVDLGSFEFLQSGPLPLTFLNFEVEQVGENAVLSWKTSNEIDTHSFEIERSLDAYKFEKIGNVKAKNSTEIQKYEFIDLIISKLNSQIAYYRLRQIDLNGKFSYSKIISFQLLNYHSKTTFGPNPLSDFAFLQINEPILLNTKAILYDLFGKKIKEFDLKENNNLLNMSDLQNAQYVLKLANGKSIKVLKR